MGERKGIAQVVRELREKYPHVSLLNLLAYMDIITDKEGELADLEALLAAENERLARDAEHFRLHVEANVERITASLAHRKLSALIGVLPPHVDREHLAGCIVYGFAAPSQPRKFFGARKVSEQALYDRVHNKLGLKFSSDHFRTALGYLIGIGAVTDQKGFSLNSNKKSMTREGRAVFDALERFLREYRNGIS